jgi:hypothetical protein
MIEACSTCGGEEEGFDGETGRKERLKDLDVGGRIILKVYLSQIGCGRYGLD